ncbi:MAG TPA: cupredoxin domain-containing protein [Candidatus Rubrimentiphilum sp.]|nr:cupredoxin domain-containing protein [Candidatus Rubrimentiphilum sp.]
MKRFFGIVLPLFAVLVFASVPVAASSATLSITASDWKFTPGTITVHVNKPVTLQLTSSQGVHGLASPELGINNTMIVPNGHVSVTFTPKKLGTYVIHCSLMCGAGHANMKLVVKVVR